jgi:molybdopterin molybdotransferase
VAVSAGSQQTGYLKTMLKADGIALVPADLGPVKAGTPVDVHVLRGAPGAGEVSE